MTRIRWRMGGEARALVFVTSVLCAFGLAVLYSASAFAAIHAGSPSMPMETKNNVTNTVRRGPMSARACIA